MRRPLQRPQCRQLPQTAHDVPQIVRGERAVTPGDIGPIYAGTDGSYYTHWQLLQKVEDGDWRPCIRDRKAGTRLVATGDEDLLMLTAIDRSDLPDWLEVRIDDVGTRVVDTRRPVPR